MIMVGVNGDSSLPQSPSSSSPRRKEEGVPKKRENLEKKEEKQEGDMRDETNGERRKEMEKVLGSLSVYVILYVRAPPAGGTLCNNRFVF